MAISGTLTGYRFPGGFPQSIINAGLQYVWDLRTSGTGTRGSPNKTAGVDTLPGGAAISSGFLIITSSCTFGDASGTGDRWDFSPLTGGVVVRGNSTIVTFWDCLFKPLANDPAVDNNQSYGLQIPDDATTHPTVTCNYCTFDGGRYNSNVGIEGPWHGAAAYVLLASSLTISRCKFTGCGYDIIKCTNSTLNISNSLLQAFGWNRNSDADGIQQISGLITVNGCIWDIYDHPNWAGQGPNSAIFCTIDTPSTGDGAVSVTNSVFYGFGQYGEGTTPFNVVSVADNHTNIGSGFHIRNGVWDNLVIDPGISHNAELQFGYWAIGGTETSAVSIATWSRVIDYATSNSVVAPVF